VHVSENEKTMTSQKEDMHFGIISTTQDQQEMLGKIPVRFVNSLVSFSLD